MGEGGDGCSGTPPTRSMLALVSAGEVETLSSDHPARTRGELIDLTTLAREGR